MNRRALWPPAWPLVLKVPMLAALLMIGVAAVVTHVVLQRLAVIQEENLQELTESYLDGLATALMPNVQRRDIWETFDILDRARDRYTGVNARFTVATIEDGTILASSDPMQFQTGAPLPVELAERFAAEQFLVLDEAEGLAWVRRDLRQEGIELGSIFAEIDIGELLRIRQDVLLTLILANGALTLGFAALGYFAVRRMVGPIALLTAHVDQLRDGGVLPIPHRHVDDQGTEFGRLFASFNEMAAASRERQALASRLADEERVAQLGKLASGMAHEVNNPLGGMLNLVDTLRKHGHDTSVRQRSLDLLERGLVGIRNLVRATLAIYKDDAAPGGLERGALDDLKFLVQHEVDRRRIDLVWRNELPDGLAINGAAVRQIALNLLLNACAASPPNGRTEFAAMLDARRLRITVQDQGPGLPVSVSECYRQPTLSDRAPSEAVGLGVWTVCLLVARLGGRIDAAAARPSGTIVTVTLPINGEPRLDAVA